MGGAALPVVDPAVPRLPATEIRQAIEDGDWPLAAGLLASHQQELAQALAGLDRPLQAREPWLDLLLAQRALLAELHSARNRVGDALARLADDHRGARAWLKELA